MNLSGIEKVKGFMPKHEGYALFNWAEKFSDIGPIFEIGSYCGKSTLYLANGASQNNQLVYTVDHHSGSEEHQLNEEYFDEDIYDFKEKYENLISCKWYYISSVLLPIISRFEESVFRR